MSAPSSRDEPASAHELAAISDRLDTDDIRYTFARAGGPGGQNVNKVSTRVTLLFDLNHGSTFTEGEVCRIRARLATRITREGCVRVVSSRHRTQRANREAALERFCGLIVQALRPRKVRKRTRVPAGAKRRRVDQKRLAGEKKRGRTRPRADGDAW